MTLTPGAITSHGKPDITVASGCAGARPGEQQHEDSKGNTDPAALVKGYRAAREKQSAELQMEDPWHYKRLRHQRHYAAHHVLYE